MEGDRAIASRAQILPQRGASTRARPRLTGGYHLHPQDRHALADAADPLGVWQWQHLLATLPCLDTTKRLARIAPSAAARPEAARTAQPGTRGDRQCLGAGLKRGTHTGPNPTDRGKNGCKRHIVTDADGIPLVVRTGPANQPDAELALEVLDAIPPCAGTKGRPRLRPKAFQGDGADGMKAIVAEVVRRCVDSLLAPYGRRAPSMAAGWGRPATSSNGRSVG